MRWRISEGPAQKVGAVSSIERLWSSPQPMSPLSQELQGVPVLRLALQSDWSVHVAANSAGLRLFGKSVSLLQEKLRRYLLRAAPARGGSGRIWGRLGFAIAQNECLRPS